jgi:hypothetical protein
LNDVRAGFDLPKHEALFSRNPAEWLPDVGDDKLHGASLQQLLEVLAAERALARISLRFIDDPRGSTATALGSA